MNHAKKKYEVQLILGYVGLARLVRRSPLTLDLQSRIVYDGDEFDFSDGSKRFIRHKRAHERGEPIWVYSHIRTLSGGEEFEIKTPAEIELHRAQYSKGSGSQSSPWNTARPEMQKKTVLRALCKTQDMGYEVAAAVAADGLSGRELAARGAEAAHASSTRDLERMADEYFEDVTDAVDVNSGNDATEKAADIAKNS